MVSPYTRYVINKTVTYTVLWFIAAFLNFLLPRIMPGDPIGRYLETLYNMAQGATGGIVQVVPEAERLRQELISRFGLDQPPYTQFFYWLINFLRGDWGYSLAFNNLPPVIDLVKEFLPNTLMILIPSLVVSWVVGNYLGAYMALKGGKSDKIGLSLMQFISLIPAYWLIIILVYVFSVWWKSQFGQPLVPTSGKVVNMIPSLSWDYVVNQLRAWILPMTTLTIIGIGGWSIGMRAYVIYQLNANYMKYAKSLGLPKRVLGRYAFRNAIIPQFTAFAISFGGLFAGNLLVEMVYGYPGMGSLLLLIMSRLDIFGMQAIFTFTATMLLLANYAADILYGFLDPRIRRGITEVV
ncbi:MAG: ABC transporter permease [Sulfolobales archaeon]